MSAFVGCGTKEITLFIGALVSGTICSVASKIMLEMKSVNLSGEVQTFSNPLFQTFLMFFGMLFGLVMHHFIIAFKINFPGYTHTDENSNEGDKSVMPTIPTWLYFYLIIPALFDLTCTMFSMYGLLYVSVSVYQMLRGGAIVFVAILKELYIGDKLAKYMWVGIFWNVISIIIVGASAIVSPDDSSDDSSGPNTDNPLLGILLILMGAFVGGLQYAFEEKVMNMEIAAPPSFLIGMEGLWGTLICVFIVYPIAYVLPGSDYGSFENPLNTIVMVQNSSSLQMMVVIFFVAVFLYNMLAVLVTFTLNSVWHAILDNFRPISVWGTEIFIYYFISYYFGEAWNSWSYLQLFGLIVLLYGTAIYNAPNPGSIKLTGTEWYSFGLDFSSEYRSQEDETEEAAVSFDIAQDKPVPPSPFLQTMSPFMRQSPALRARSGSQATPSSSSARSSLVPKNSLASHPESPLNAASRLKYQEFGQFQKPKKQNSFA